MSMAVVADGDTRNTVVVAGPHDVVCTLAVDRLKEFLEVHRSWIVVATNAAQLYWSLVDELVRTGDWDAEVGSLLGGWRLLDVEFFEQRLRYTRDGRATIKKSLPSPLTSERSNWSPMAIAVAQARETRKRYLNLRAQAANFLESWLPEAPAMVGETLGVAIDVLGSIAALGVTRAKPIELRPDYRNRLLDLLNAAKNDVGLGLSFRKYSYSFGVETYDVPYHSAEICNCQ